MKNVYLVIIVSCACLMTFVPQRSSAQCLCSGGVAPTAITYLDTIPVTNAASTTISFPKFDPAIGTLGCVSFDDTISGVTTTTAWNLQNSKWSYSFLLLVDNTITGPGVLSDKSFTKIYGPDSLNAKGNSPGDSITYGPDSLFTNIKDQKFSTSTASYLGASGNVNFIYSLGGGLNSIGGGGLNYGDQIVTNYWGTFKLTYYWCPAGLLANLISNFSAAKNGNNVQLKWQAQNEQKDIGYDIEYSTDGSNYFSAGSLKSNDADEGTLASYQFQYSISSGSEKLFFRIKRTSADGKSIVYSVIKTVNINSGGIAGYHTYPNPVKSYTMIEFDQVLSGNYIVDLVNTAGQIVQHKEVSLSGSNQIRLDLTSHPATGIYYLQVKDQNKIHQYISKIVIE